MKHQFDELTKSMAQSVTRRAALKKFGLGLAGMALACFGLANKAKAQTSCLPNGYVCTQDSDCCSGYCKSYWVWWPSLGSNKKVKVRVQTCDNK
jgi:hypothetical protein